MGEARVTLKATFKTTGDADLVLLWLCRLLDERANRYWQLHRGQTGPEFWPDFTAKHPLSAAVLAVSTFYDKDGDTPVVPGETHPNNLCGLLDWPDDVLTDYKGNKRAEDRPAVKGRNLHHEATTWYWARWAPLARALVAHGAVKVEWQNPIGHFLMGADGEYARVDNKRELQTA